MSTIPPIQPIADDVCVTGQLEPDVMSWAAQRGFRSVVNNRPDHEGGAGQPTSQAIEAAAHAAGLVYVYLPVAPSVQTRQEIASFAQLLHTLPRPILMFCRSGTRSGKLYRAATGG